MPTFPPTPPGLPKVLNPLNPRHYWLLFTWIYFRPSHLKHYLHQIDPQLYADTGRQAMLTTLRLPAYRNLYAMSLALTIALSIGVAWVASVAQGTPMDWGWLAFGVAVGMAGGVAVGVAVGVAGSVAGGVAVGVAFGVAGGMAGVVAFGVAVGMVLGVAGVVALGVAFGVAGVVAGVVAGGMAVGVAVGVAFGVAGVVAGVVAFGVAVGVAFGVAFGVAVGVAVGVAFGVAFGVAVGVAVGAGGSRLLFHFVEWPLAWWWSRSTHDPFARLEHHPVVWDEIAVWPLPGTDKLLRAGLNQDFESGLRLATVIAANPFQRWAVQRTLADFIAQHSRSLEILYTLAHQPALAEYLFPPVGERQFDELPNSRLVLLGEVGQVFVDGTGGISKTSERAVWRLTRRWRRMEPSPIASFSFMLYELLRDEAELEDVDVVDFKLREWWQGEWEAIRPLPHGAEVANSFEALAQCLEVQALPDIACLVEELNWMEALEQPYLRPLVMEALKALRDVGGEVAVCERATNNRQKSAALNRAAGALNELAGYIEEKVLPPEKVLLKRVVQHWQSIIAEAQGQLGQAALREMTPAMRREAGVAERTSAVWARPTTPIDNPYVVGNPVYPPLFVGRADVFNRIGEVWSAKAVPDSIIIYGHRRMGKSSILRNLNQAAPEGSVICYADLAGETAFVASTADLLLGLADKIYAVVQRAFPQVDFTRPDSEAYATPAKAQFQFNRLTDQARAALNGRPLILALDEFEGVERAVSAGKIGPEIYQLLRTKSQEPGLTLVFGGLHTLDEMSREYQQPFFGSYTNILVSYLSPADAWRLITNPTPDFDLNYEPEAVNRIIAETGGQPYLVQQVCRDALDHLNHELFDEGRERDVKIALADVDAVLGPDFFRRGTVYFDGVWTQANLPNYRTLLRVLAKHDEPWSLAELETEALPPSEGLMNALRWAERHDILRKTDGESPRWDFYVPLMRRWVNERAPA